MAAQRFISNGTGRMGYFNREGDQVNPDNYIGEARDELHQKEIREGSMETGVGFQAQWAHRFASGLGELLGQGGLVRFTNFATDESRTEINAMLGFNFHLISKETPEAFHPYLGFRFGGSYDVDHQTLGLGFTPIIPTVLGLRIPLGDHFQLDSSASFLVDILPEQNNQQDQAAIRLQGGLGILYQP